MWAVSFWWMIFFVEKTTLHRTFHHAEKYEGNPILKPETPGEIHGTYTHAKDDPTGSACPLDDGVFYDPADRHSASWGSTWVASTATPASVTSEDGLHWQRPQFDVDPGTNNVIPDHPEFFPRRLFALVGLERGESRRTLEGLPLRALFGAARSEAALGELALHFSRWHSLERQGEKLLKTTWVTTRRSSTTPSARNG